jgi:hypothetical protein
MNDALLSDILQADLQIIYKQHFSFEVIILISVLGKVI